MIRYLDLQRLHASQARWLEAATAALQSGRYLLGDETRLFEQEYATYIGTKHCIGCGNGLDALTLILRAYIELGRLHEGDEVIVPAHTFIATPLAVTENRLKPVFVDADPTTMQIDDRLIERAITPRTRAILIVHLYGTCSMTPLIADLCQQHHLLLIEDNAQAHGCCYESPMSNVKRTGSLGDAAGHSFYPGKNLGAMGDAGCITTDDDELAAAVRSLGNYGSSQKYVCDYLGRNSRIDEVQAAILRRLLPLLDEGNRRRKQIAHYYHTHIDHPLITLSRTDRDSVWHIFPVLCTERDRLQQYLFEKGVETLVHYPIPPHRQRCYASLSTLSLPVSESIAATELSLPCNPAMTDDDVHYVADVVHQFKV